MNVHNLDSSIDDLRFLEAGHVFLKKSAQLKGPILGDILLLPSNMLVIRSIEALHMMAF